MKTEVRHCACKKYLMSDNVQIVEPAGMKHSAIECISREAAMQRRMESLVRALQKIADHRDPDPWRDADGMRALARGALLEGP